MQRLNKIGLICFILTVALLGKTIEHDIVEEEYKQAEVSDAIQLYKDDFMSIDKYEIKDKKINIKILNLSWSIRFIKWNDNIYPLSYSEYGETGLSFFYTKEDAFILLDLPTQEVPRYDIVHVRNNILKYIGYTEYNKQKMFAKDSLLKEVQSAYDLDFKLKVKDNKPIFFYEKDGRIDVNDVIFEKSDLENKKGYLVEYLVSSDIVKKKFISIEKVEEYFKKIEKNGTPYFQKECLSSQEKKKLITYQNMKYENFIKCESNGETILEKFVCQSEDFLLMFHILSQQFIYQRENAVKYQQKSYKGFFDEYVLFRMLNEDFYINSFGWSSKYYEHNKKINKKSLCYDLKVETNAFSSYDPIYTQEDIARVEYNPKFKDYNIETTYLSLNKPLIQKDFGRLYRTRLKQALKEKKPEFAGKYIIVEWGCDEGKDECTTGGVIDASTGKATPLPFKHYTHNGNKEVIYKLNSSLIIFAGSFDVNGKVNSNKVLFYKIKDGEFLFLKSAVYKK